MLVTTKDFVTLLLRNVSDLKLRLYTNDYHPHPSSLYDDFTEPTDLAYRPRRLRGEKWRAEQKERSVTSTHKERCFKFTTQTKVYGYFVTKGGKVMWAERFAAAPFCLLGMGGTVNVTPTITFNEAEKEEMLQDW